MLAFAPPLKEVQGKHAITVLILLLLGAVFFIMLFQTVNKYGGKIAPKPGQKGPAAAARARPAGYSDAGQPSIPA